MDTKLVYIISQALSAVATGFYYYSGKSKDLDIQSNADFFSHAEKLQITQTNENGQLYAKATIDKALQWANSENAELNLVKGMLYQDGLPNASFVADQMLIQNNYQNIDLLGNIVLEKTDPQGNPTISFKTDKLQGDTKTNQIKTDRLVLITNPQAQFTSQGLNANISTGQYEFFNIRGKYNAVSQ